MARYQSSRRKESPKSRQNPSSDVLQPRPFAPDNQAQPPVAHPVPKGQDPKVPTLVTFNRPQPIQPKLTIGAPGDKYEQEADRVASQVVQHINSPSTNPKQAVQRETMPEEDELQMKPMLQRETMPEEEELQMKPMLQREVMPEEDELQMKSALSTGIVEGDASPNLETAIQQARGSGQALAPDLQAKMGQAMGADFSNVRVHTDTQSDHLNRSIQAKAFTTGQDIFFRQGAYQPGNRGGQELIAHELTHVVQQGGGQQKRVSAKRQPAEIKLSLPQGGPMRSIQRLSLHNTDWSGVTQIKASSGGVGGVLFISDAQSTLVVKPDVHKDEEMIASHLHGAMSESSQKKRGGKWNISNLDRRFASLNDVRAIKHKASKVAPLEDVRLQKILRLIRPDTTMIQEMAKNSSGYGELLQDQAKKGGHIITPEDRKVGKKAKVQKDSPLKPLTKDPSFTIALGRLAAADIFLGNFDRIMKSSNLDNLMMNFSKGKISPIDNVDPLSKIRFTPDPGANNITLNDWTSYPLVDMFLNGHYAQLAEEVWNPDVVTMDTHMKFFDDLVAGEKTGANPREYNVNPGERNAVTAKLKKHLNTIMANFARGLAIGRAEIIKAGPLPKNGKWSDNSADLYNQRLALL
jgi:hypothetical protein